MSFLIPLFFCVFICIFIFRRCEDISHSKLIYSGSFKRSQIKLISLIACSMLILSILFLQVFSFLYIPQLLLYICAVCTLLLLAVRSNRLYNSIEDIYEGLLVISLAAYFISSNPLPIFVISSLVHFTSLSAGVQKLSSRMWRRPNTFALAKFMALPSVARESSRSFVSMYSRHNVFRKAISSIGFIAPYLQIFFPVIFIFGALFDIYWFALSGFLFQLLFALSLFLIADLSWITSFYLLLSCIAWFSLSVLKDFDFFTITTVSAFTSLFASLFSLTSIFLLFSSSHSVAPLRRICLGIGPFSMFTEKHSHNIITHHFLFSSRAPLRQNHLLFSLNAFDQNGVRNHSQNFRSRNAQGFMYPLGDYFMKFALGHNCLYKNFSHKMQVERLLEIPCLESIDFFQNVWNEDCFCYETIHVGFCDCNSHFAPVLTDSVLPNARQLTLRS